jgi:leader peptidase (prepilin peptidase)/N-methyltransferase
MTAQSTTPASGSLTLAAAGGGAAGALAGFAAGDSPWSVLVGTAAGALGAPIAVWDVRLRRIPNWLVLLLAGAAAVLGLTAAWLDGRVLVTHAVLGAVLAGAPLLIVHLCVPSGIGFGDVKLGAALGALLGVVSPGLAMASVLVASAGAALAGVSASSRRGAGAPFGAWLVGGALGLLAVRRWFLS